MKDKEKFIVELYPAAVKVSQETGMAWQTILAQAAQETGWGQHQLQGTHNLFNIKADSSWHGPSMTFNVWEIENGQKIWKAQSFRVYGSYEEALRDRIEFLRNNPRYAQAGLFDESTKGHLAKEASALQRAGYATDPHYAENLIRVFDSSTMQRAIKGAQSLETMEHNAPDTPSHPTSSPHLQTAFRPETHNQVVQALQFDLTRLGYTDRHGHPLVTDGIYGIDTQHAVNRFQHDHHLTADGIAGPKTQQALHAALQEHTAHHAAAHSLDDAHHPDHALFAQALAGVRALDAEHGRATDQHSLNLAAALTVEARREGLAHIDQVLLNDNASRTIAIQNSTSMLEPTRFASVDTMTALQTPMTRSSMLAASVSPPSVELAPQTQSPVSVHAMGL
jgi:peptidoglycan hydrolase-like protein with peptidoglycan-binding domain